eukprot:489934_1
MTTENNSGDAGQSTTDVKNESAGSGALGFPEQHRPPHARVPIPRMARPDTTEPTFWQQVIAVAVCVVVCIALVCLGKWWSNVDESRFCANFKKPEAGKESKVLIRILGKAGLPHDDKDIDLYSFNELMTKCKDKYYKERTFDRFWGEYWLGRDAAKLSTCKSLCHLGRTIKDSRMRQDKPDGFSKKSKEHPYATFKCVGPSTDENAEDWEKKAHFVMNEESKGCSIEATEAAFKAYRDAKTKKKDKEQEKIKDRDNKYQDLEDKQNGKIKGLKGGSSAINDEKYGNSGDSENVIQQDNAGVNNGDQ